MGAKLNKASGDGDVEHVTKLLNEGAPVDWSDDNRWTSVHEACYNNRPSVVKVLLQHYSPINQQTNGGNTPLHFACRHSSTACVELLLTTGECDLG